MFVLTLKLNATKADRADLERRFQAAWHVKNVVIKHAQKQLSKLFNDKKYKETIALYNAVEELRAKTAAEPEPESGANTKGKKSQKKLVSTDLALNARHDELAAILKERREYYGLSKSGLEFYSKGQNRQMKKLLSSSQVQAITDDVWRGVEKVLFSNGKMIHLKKLKEMKSISGKNHSNGVRYYDPDHTDDFLKSMTPVFPDGEIEYLGLHIRCKIDREDPYVREALTHKIKYCTITRKLFNNGYHYYVQLTLDGPAPKKLVAGNGEIGIDPGISSVSAVGDNSYFMEELAPDAKKYEAEIAALQRSVDRSLRQSDPDNYNEDGTAKKGKRTIHPSNTCKRKMRQIAVLHRKEAENREHSQRNLANRMIVEAGAGVIKYEDMEWAALAKRTKDKTREAVEAQKAKAEEETQNQSSSDCAKTAGANSRSSTSGKPQAADTTTSHKKNKRRKRGGKSTQLHAPGQFERIIESKVNQYGGVFARVNTRELKASQYRHDTGTFEPVPLSQRTKIIDGHEVQRDGYSSLIIKCADSTPAAVDVEKLKNFFKKYLSMESAAVAFAKAAGVSMKQVFGF